MKWTAIGAALALATGMAACGGTSTNPTTTGTLTAMLQDSPFSDAQALLVTFSEVSAHLSGGDFTPLAFSGGASTRTCDLKRLTASDDVLGTGPLPTGHYTELRLVVSSAVVYLDNPTTGDICGPAIPPPAGASAPVTIPSGTVMLNREFDVTNNQTTTITLDFNGDQSVIKTGSGTYMMTPVISVLGVQ